MICYGVDDFFFVFFGGKVVDMYYGENALFYEIEISYGMDGFFITDFPCKNCRYILWGNTHFWYDFNNGSRNTIF